MFTLTAHSSNLWIAFSTDYEQFLHGTVDDLHSESIGVGKMEQRAGAPHCTE